MALRILEIVVSNKKSEDLSKVLDGLDVEIIDKWEPNTKDNLLTSKLLIESQYTEKITGELEKNFESDDEFRIVLMPVEASFPKKSKEKTEEDKNTPNRISREELYNDINEASKLNRNYFLLVFLSSIVATVGLIQNNTAIIIGAMVIAPLLGPNMALALGTTLGDISLIKRSMKTNFSGVLLAFITSMILGFFFTVDPYLGEISLRTSPDFEGILISLAAGGAGALAFTTGISAALVGVMVAVALLPPTVTVGMLIGSQHWSFAYGAAVVLLTNIICINLSAVLIFIFQGIKPKKWWEEEKAKKSTQKAIIIWVAMLAALVLMIYFY